LEAFYFVMLECVSDNPARWSQKTISNENEVTRNLSCSLTTSAPIKLLMWFLSVMLSQIEVQNVVCFAIL